MNWFAVVASTIFVVLIGALMIAMPAITPKTTPLGVSVPLQRAEEPVVRRAVARFRRGVVVAAVVTVAVTAGLAAIDPVWAIVVPTLLMVVLTGAAYVLTRRSIQRVKADEGWFDEVPVRLTGSIVPPEQSTAGVPLGWYLGSVVVLAITVAVGVARYAELPDPMPIHWDAAGQVDGFAPKSVWSVFGPLMIGGGMIVLFYAMSLLARRSPSRRMSGMAPEESRRHAAVTQHLLLAALGQLLLLVTLLMSVLSLLAWFPSVQAAMPLAMVLFLFLTALVLAGLVMRYVRAGHRVKEPAPAGTTAAAAQPRPDAPDDDRYWKAGLFYVNRNDPAVLVPKRFGIGWTVNLGHPGVAVGAIVFTVLIVALGIVLPGFGHLGAGR